MSKKTRKRFTSQEKVAILRRHLLEHTPISELYDQHGIHPTMFYRWQKEFFENAAAALEPCSRRTVDAKDREIAFLKQKLQRKARSPLRTHGSDDRESGRDSGRSVDDTALISVSSRRLIILRTFPKHFTIMKMEDYD